MKPTYVAKDGNKRYVFNIALLKRHQTFTHQITHTVEIYGHGFSIEHGHVNRMYSFRFWWW